jgi:hypothetical protein
MTRAGTGSQWTHLLSGHNTKNLVNVISTSGPCSSGSNAEAQVNFAGSWYAEKWIGASGTDQETSYTQLQVCAVEREEEQPYSAGGEEEDPGDDTTCLVNIRYWQDTGEIISVTVLYCW